MNAVREELSFTYFPENYRWSHGLLIGLNYAAQRSEQLAIGFLFR